MILILIGVCGRHLGRIAKGIEANLHLRGFNSHRSETQQLDGHDVGWQPHPLRASALRCLLSLPTCHPGGVFSHWMLMDLDGSAALPWAGSTSRWIIFTPVVRAGLDLPVSWTVFATEETFRFQTNRATNTP